MRNDYRYAITDCFDTFPFCFSNKMLDKLGEELDGMQRDLAIQRDIGLTELYTLVNAISCNEQDILDLRAFFVSRIEKQFP